MNGGRAKSQKTEKTLMSNCKKCGAELRIPTTGRPPTYCGVACRRSAEFEIRRINKRLETYETERDHLRELAKLPHTPRYFDGRDVKRRLEDIETTIANTEERLRSLLNDGSEEPL